MTFPFLRLPSLAKNEVIRSMDRRDCIILALTSKRAAGTVRMANIRTLFAEIHISSTPKIKLWGQVILGPTGKIWKEKELSKCNHQSSNSIVKSTARVYNRMDSIFGFKEPLTLIFSDDYKKVTTVKEVLSDPTMCNWDECVLIGETKDSEELNAIMDMASHDRWFFCNVKEFPTDFRHKNAFKFRFNEYEDARWVKIEDLYGMNNCYGVVLKRNNFTKTHIKEFIYYWVNTEVDMFVWMRITTVEVFDLVEMLYGLTILHIQHRAVYLTMAKSSETREKTLLCFSNHGNNLQLSAWGPGEFQSGCGVQFDETIRNKKGVIGLLIEKKQLEVELKSGDGESKEGISKRLKQLDIEIQGYGVFFVDGKATLRIPTQ
ncbi:unnamed protein product [Caenorhabditis brenneri]